LTIIKDMKNGGRLAHSSLRTKGLRVISCAERLSRTKGNPTRPAESATRTHTPTHAVGR
jgi:hypothetical protein